MFKMSVYKNTFWECYLYNVVGSNIKSSHRACGSIIMAPSLQVQYSLTGKTSGKTAFNQVGDWNLIQGSPCDQNGWYIPPELNVSAPVSSELSAWPDTYSLFNINEDPQEREDVAAKYPEVLDTLKQRLEEWKATLVPANFPPDDPLADPKYYGGVWSPGWC